MTIIIFDVETKRGTNDVAKQLGLKREGDAFNYPHLMEFGIGVLYDLGVGEFKSFLTAKEMAQYILSRKDPRLVSFNGKRFDIPTMYNQLDIDTINKLSALPHLDMLELFYRKVDFRFRVSLDNLAKNTIGITKSGNGADAPVMYQKGQIGKLIAYCRQDVEVTKELYKHIREHKSWKYFDMQTGTKKEMILNGTETDVSIM